MKDFRQKTAVITGAASGIGRAIACRLAEAGAQLVLADIDGEALEATQREVAAMGAKTRAWIVDVSDRAAVEDLAHAAVAAFGRVHLLVNNAGVIMRSTPFLAAPAEDWDWLVGVNLLGVVHGVRAFLPAMRAHGEPAHIVNTASSVALHVNGDGPSAAYSMTKYGVVALSEALQVELRGTNVGVSVLCPAGVDTGIWRSTRRRPDRFGGPELHDDDWPADVATESLWSAARVAHRLVDAIRGGEFFVFTHTNFRRTVAQRHAQIEAAFDRAAAWDASHPPRSRPSAGRGRDAA